MKNNISSKNKKATTAKVQSSIEKVPNNTKSTVKLSYIYELATTIRNTKMQPENIFDLTDSLDIIDSSKLLDRYFEETNNINSDFKKLATNAKKCDDFINEIAYKLQPIVSRKRKQFEEKVKEIPNEVSLLKAKFHKTTDPVLKNELVQKVSLLSDNFENDGKKFNEFYEALNETMSIFKPIKQRIKSIKKLKRKINLAILIYKVRKIAINITLLLVVSFILNYILDWIQGLTESKYQINHFYLLFISFFIQTFIIDPYILTKLRTKLNFDLIRKLKNRIPTIKQDLLVEKSTFNENVCRWQELEQFKV